PARNAPASAGRHLAPELPQPEPQRGPVSLAGKPVRTAPPSQQASGQPEQLKGVRRNMARVMADAHAQVVPTTLVDDDGLFVPALRNADVLDATGVRAAIKRLRTQVEDRTIPASELSGYTISLSNFGMIGGIEVHRRMPLSLTFDHRAATGGEAARFLKAMLDDLSQPN